MAPSLELLFLLYLSSDVMLKLIWIKPKFTFKHRRTVFKVCVCIMYFVHIANCLLCSCKINDERLEQN